MRNHASLFSMPLHPSVSESNVQGERGSLQGSLFRQPGWPKPCITSADTAHILRIA